MIKDLLPVGLIFTLIVSFSNNLYTSYSLKKEESRKLEAMQLTIYLDKEIEKSNQIYSIYIDMLKTKNKLLKENLKEYKHVDNIVKDIRRAW